MKPAFAAAVPLLGASTLGSVPCMHAERSVPVCLNRRSEAAKRRWQDPEYRAKMKAARAGNALVTKRVRTQPTRRAAAAAASADGLGLGVDVDPTLAHTLAAPQLWKARPNYDQDNVHRHQGVIEIGVGDSLTLCDEKKAAAINSYVRRNKQRSEKLIMFHNDKQRWMDIKLQQGEGLRMLINNEQLKRERQLMRQAEARKRHARIRARKQAEQDALRNGASEDSS